MGKEHIVIGKQMLYEGWRWQGLLNSGSVLSMRGIRNTETRCEEWYEWSMDCRRDFGNHQVLSVRCVPPPWSISECKLKPGEMDQYPVNRCHLPIALPFHTNENININILGLGPYGPRLLAQVV